MTITGTGGGGLLLGLSSEEVSSMLGKWYSDSDALPLMLPGDQPSVAREIQRASNGAAYVAESPAAATPGRCTFEATIDQAGGIVRIAATVEIG